MVLSDITRRTSGLHGKIARDAKLPNLVHCRECGRSQSVDPAYCLAHGWPKCCGYTMTIDQPKGEEKGMTFESGQKVRINPEAWGDSTEPEDVEACGQIVTLRHLVDDNDNDPLWEAELESGTRVFPVESELEPMPANAGE